MNPFLFLIFASFAITERRYIPPPEHVYLPLVWDTTRQEYKAQNWRPGHQAFLCHFMDLTHEGLHQPGAMWLQNHKHRIPKGAHDAVDKYTKPALGYGSMILTLFSIHARYHLRYRASVHYYSSIKVALNEPKTGAQYSYRIPKQPLFWHDHEMFHKTAEGCLNHFKRVLFDVPEQDLLAQVKMLVFILPSTLGMFNKPGTRYEMRMHKAHPLWPDFLRHNHLTYFQKYCVDDGEIKEGFELDRRFTFWTWWAKLKALFGRNSN